MDKVSDDRLDTMIMSYEVISMHDPASNNIFMALTELRDRREYEKDKGLVEDWRNLSKSYENIP